MSYHHMDAMLFCIECNENTNHTITYRNEKIENIKCNQCGREIKIDHEYIQRNFKEDIVERVLSKPSRMTKEMEEDITLFITSLPFRVISKPYRLMKEIYKGKQ